MKPNDPVEDAEVLYRATRPNDISFKSGRVVISSKAFHDSSQEISVDRSQLQQQNPIATLERLPQATGVISVTAREARDISPVEHTFRNQKGSVILDDQKQPKTAESRVDVRPDPWPKSSPDNQAHALIYGAPDFKHQNMFKLLVKRLTIVAKVEINSTGQ